MIGELDSCLVNVGVLSWVPKGGEDILGCMENIGCMLEWFCE